MWREEIFFSSMPRPEPMKIRGRPLPHSQHLTPKDHILLCIHCSVIQGYMGGVRAWFTDRRRTISESMNAQEVTRRDVGGAGYRFIDGGGGILCSNSLHSCLMSSTSSLVSGRCITMLTSRRSQALVNLCTSFATCTTHQFSPLPRSY